ncbi:MAG TPA: helix-turn-helix domain-containing protein [Quisquiliibacterium sp.]|jgi:predicted DNA-binding transcriptional regulator AlpA|nr:helix-turn-helix domain-containing protein [Quisquiliibacterium sp.]
MARRKADPIDFDELISVVQLAERFGVTRRSVERYIADGKLPEPRKLFSERYFLKRDIAQWLGDVFAEQGAAVAKSDSRRAHHLP